MLCNRLLRRRLGLGNLDYEDGLGMSIDPFPDVKLLPSIWAGIWVVLDAVISLDRLTMVAALTENGSWDAAGERFAGPVAPEQSTRVTDARRSRGHLNTIPNLVSYHWPRAVATGLGAGDQTYSVNASATSSWVESAP